MKNSLALWAIIALIIGGLLGYYIGYSRAESLRVTVTDNSMQDMRADTSPSNKALELKLAMRKLWTDHTVWTREYIIAAAADAPDKDAAAARLMKNQEDIGNAIASYYGSDAGTQLTTLLKEHISIAVDLVDAAKANNQAQVSAENAKWQANANAIADFLSNTNPNWPNADLRAMMRTHLDTTTKEVQARLNKDWQGDVAAYDAVYDHILKMSDALTDGIVQQFSDKF
jgi:hypothetical protein